MPSKASSPDSKPLAERMRAWRDAKGLSQADAAALVGVSQRNWQNWEQGHRANPRINGVMPVLKVLFKDGF
jgi:transcriptional regulator with XRE-family HTH domain